MVAQLRSWRKGQAKAASPSRPLANLGSGENTSHACGPPRFGLLRRQDDLLDKAWLRSSA
jgi:hypothetical protein